MERRQQGARLRKKHLPAFVISVGNLVVGGTGKTPLSLWLARYLEKEGWRTAILSRGYGRKNSEVERVSLHNETRSQVLRFGDEPVLMARCLPGAAVWVGRNRWLAGREAIRSFGADILLLDDGFQHLSLHRDLDLVLLDAHNPFGNGALLPAGPLREPVEHLARADAVLLTRAEDKGRMLNTRSLLHGRFSEKPVFSCKHGLVEFRMGLDGAIIPLEHLLEQRVVAFAGIARPAAFFHSLENLGIGLRHRFSFPDHHFYGMKELEQLTAVARKSGTRFLITTQKDLVRLPCEFRDIILSAKVELDFGSEENVFRAYLKNRIQPILPHTLPSHCDRSSQ